MASRTTAGGQVAEAAPPASCARFPAATVGRFGLTPRELDVLRLVATGMRNRQLGAELFISVNTAGVHVSRILTKLGLATRTEAAAFAHEHGLLADTGWPPAHGSTERDISPLLTGAAARARPSSWPSL